MELPPGMIHTQVGEDPTIVVVISHLQRKEGLTIVGDMSLLTVEGEPTVVRGMSLRKIITSSLGETFRTKNWTMRRAALIKVPIRNGKKETILMRERKTILIKIHVRKRKKETMLMRERKVLQGLKESIRKMKKLILSGNPPGDNHQPKHTSVMVTWNSNSKERR